MVLTLFPIHKKAATLIFFFLSACSSFSQRTDTSKRIVTFYGAVDVLTKTGIL